MRVKPAPAHIILVCRRFFGHERFPVVLASPIRYFAVLTSYNFKILCGVLW